jgi:PleD family two-component response regulator
VLNIEELPFVKYNLYTERLLFIIISLIEPSLHKAVEYNAIMQREEVDGLTGLPLFTSFYNVLQKELERKQIEQGKISIIVLDIVNYPDIIAEHDETKVKGELIPQIIQAIYQATENQGQGFQFKMDNQFGFIFPNLDYDGASLYCLEILERMNSFDVSLEDRKLPLEVIIGFSAFAGNEDADDMIDRAENLLEMQKV